MILTHLERLEAESIHIMRELFAETERSVILYSTAKDRSVVLHLALFVLHLALKAFHSARPPRYPASSLPPCQTGYDLYSPGDGVRYGKLWLTPYMTGKDP